MNPTQAGEAVKAASAYDLVGRERAGLKAERRKARIERTFKNYRWWVTWPIALCFLPVSVFIIAGQWVGDQMERKCYAAEMLLQRLFRPMHDWVNRKPKRNKT